MGYIFMLKCNVVKQCIVKYLKWHKVKYAKGKQFWSDGCLFCMGVLFVQALIILLCV